MSEKKLKSIAFDLDTKALQKHYTKGDWHNAYNDIGDFLASIILSASKVQSMTRLQNLAMMSLAY